MEPALPIWARPEAFPPADAGWGWVDRKGRRNSCESFDELSAAIVDDAGARVDLVWTPASKHLVLPEELPELHPALKEARIRWANWDIEEGQRQMIVFGIAFAVMGAWSLYTREIALAPLALAVVLFLVLGFFPWNAGRKRLKRARQWAAGDVVIDVSALRFETWLLQEKAPITYRFLLLLAIVGLVQYFAPGDLNDTVAKAGLLKVNGHVTDWWRLATAPFLHGHWIHFFFNATALLYLGRRMEALVGWAHITIVFVLSAWVGGQASAYFMPNTPSLGASGGLMGMLGFLLVFESMHQKLVPDSSRRRLLAALIFTAAIGLVGFKLIDNGAHGGGLVAGMLYAFAVFPKSSSAKRPDQTKLDRIAGSIAAALIISAAVWTCVVLFR